MILSSPATASWVRRAGGPAVHVVERNALAYRRSWILLITGFAEPVLYLMSIGLGVGGLVGDIEGVPYREFVAPALLATAAMTVAVFDASINFFVKYKYLGTYDAILATPLGVADVALGELGWVLVREGAYATIFLATMALFGVVNSWWALLAVPVALLIAFAFTGAGLWATTFMRSFVDFDYVNLAVIPMFLFSATFFPVTRYPDVLEVVVRLTPLYQGVALERALVLGDVTWGLLGHAAYLALMGTVGLRAGIRRLRVLLQP